MLKNKLLKFVLRVFILFAITIAIVLVLVVQPVFTDKNLKPQVTNEQNLKKNVYHLSETIPEQAKDGYRLDNSADYIFSQMSQYTSPYYQDFDVQGVTYRNVVVSMKGLSDCGTYVIGAHYDTYDDLPGADDNLSGVAGLIELTRLFAENPPKCDLQLVAYTLEEPPYFRSEYMGSYVHAQTLHDENIDVKAMLSLEMIGYFNDEIGSQNYPIKGMKHLYSDKGDFISLVGNMAQIGLTRKVKKSMRSSTDLPVFSINAPAIVQGIDFSDHLNYWQFDFPAIMVTDTAFNRNKNYHTQLDTAEKLDYQRITKVVDGVYYAIHQLMDQ
ncbi:MAG: M28 family peptidase [Marinicellaceae bacterium]